MFVYLSIIGLILFVLFIEFAKNEHHRSWFNRECAKVRYSVQKK